MNPVYDQLKIALPQMPKRWLVTGVAGFIGSHLLETLLELEQSVVGLDNFLTGRRENLEEVQARVQRGRWARFRLIEGDIQDLGVCRRACEGVGVVLHQAALGSVPRSLTDPLGCHHNNVTGFLNMLLAAQEAQIKRFVYASSSSVYGDAPEVRKVEDQVGKPLSPYAASKAIDEVYAGAFARAYDLVSIGLRKSIHGSYAPLGLTQTSGNSVSAFLGRSPPRKL